MPGLKILVTSGATREPIDEVRYISNISTGKTGAALADFFCGTGFNVTYVRGEGAAEPRLPCAILGYGDYRSLDRLLELRLGTEKYFAVIHLAAVSDYSVKSVLVGDRSFSPEELRKVDSGEELGILLQRNTKILDRLKRYGSGAPIVVGFKLTHEPVEARRIAAVERVAGSGGVDAVVHNDLGQIRSGGKHQFQLYVKRGGAMRAGRVCEGTEELGGALVEFFREHPRGFQ